MNKQTAIVTLIAICTLSRAFAGDSPTPVPSPSASVPPWPCQKSGWNPELHTLYGSQQSILGRLDTIPAKLSERRVFLQVTQGDSDADVRLYERQDDGTFKVTAWNLKESSRLLAEVDKAIVAKKDNKSCIGQGVKDILTRELKTGTVSDPVSVSSGPEEAFGPSVKKTYGDFISTTVIILC